MNFRELGALYKKVRQSRGYSISDVTSDYLNKSQYRSLKMVTRCSC